MEESFELLVHPLSDAGEDKHALQYSVPPKSYYEVARCKEGGTRTA